MSNISLTPGDWTKLRQIIANLYKRLKNAKTSYDPEVFKGHNSATLGNGMIIKRGTLVTGNDGIVAHTFHTPFPNAFLSMFAAPVDAQQVPVGWSCYGTSAEGFSIRYGLSEQQTFYWTAIGW